MSLLYEDIWICNISQTVVPLGSNYAPHPQGNISLACVSPNLAWHLSRGAMHFLPMSGTVIATRESSHLMN